MQQRGMRSVLFVLLYIFDCCFFAFACGSFGSLMVPMEALIKAAGENQLDFINTSRTLITSMTCIICPGFVFLILAVFILFKYILKSRIPFFKF